MHIAGVRTARIAVAVALASALLLTLLGLQANADELVAHRSRVKQQIVKTKSDLGESSSRRPDKNSRQPQRRMPAWL